MGICLEGVMGWWVDGSLFPFFLLLLGYPGFGLGVGFWDGGLEVLDVG